MSSPSHKPPPSPEPVLERYAYQLAHLQPPIRAGTNWVQGNSRFVASTNSRTSPPSPRSAEVGSPHLGGNYPLRPITRSLHPVAWVLPEMRGDWLTRGSEIPPGRKFL